MRLGPVDEGQAFLGPELVRREPGRSERSGSKHPVAGRRKHFSLSHERQSDVAQRGQIPARPNASLLRHQRLHSGVEHADQSFYQSRCHSACRPEEDIGAEQHDRAHHGGRERTAHAGGMTAHEVGLELVELIGGNPYVGELPEAGIDPVDRLS